MPINPFRPSAGAEPPSIIGRDQAIVDFVSGLEGGVGAPGRLMRISGPRGSGKTVLLTDLGNRAAEMGWDVANVSEGVDLVDDLVYELSPATAVDAVSMTGSIGVVSGGTTIQVKQPNLRALMKRSAEKAGGLVITIDEVQDASEEDIQRIASAVQLLIREKVNIAFVFAGLPMGVMDLINGKALTFLRRAVSENLRDINLLEVGLSLEEVFSTTGLKLAGDQLKRVTQATDGYAYLIQLVGYYVWQRGDLHRSSSIVISDEDVSTGLQIAIERFHETVHEPAIAGLGKEAMEYLFCMAQDSGTSSTAEVSKRMGKTPKATSSYRRTLLQREVIQAPARGYVEFAVPLLREYLLENEEELRERYI